MMHLHEHSTRTDYGIKETRNASSEIFIRTERRGRKRKRRRRGRWHG